ncbi:hypothetical protein WT05_15535 [Burkholderia stagnalis]|nr:hypothetical protein WT05_15535 [Burkholderia stagnalis]
MLERLEREVLAGVPRTPASDGVTVLQVPFENDDAFDRRVDDLPVAIVSFSSCAPQRRVRVTPRDGVPGCLRHRYWASTVRRLMTPVAPGIQSQRQPGGQGNDTRSAE